MRIFSDVAKPRAMMYQKNEKSRLSIKFITASQAALQNGSFVNVFILVPPGTE